MRAGNAYPDPAILKTMLKIIQNSWLSGQLDEQVSGRQDMAQYRNGASTLLNFLPVMRGGIRKRPGTVLKATLSDVFGTAKFRMIPFGYLSNQGYVLVIAQGVAKVYDINATPTTVYDVTVSGNGTIPYLEAELDDIGYVQCGDVIFFAHKNHPPAKISHDVANGVHTFTFENVTFNPVATSPTISQATYSRAYFDNFTFNSDIQNKIDTCKTHANFLDDEDGWAAWYRSLYNNESNRHYNPTTSVYYKASVLIDGSEGPLSNAASISFSEPWTESQVATITITVTIPAGTKKWEIRLYKENGGVYGLIGIERGTTTGAVSKTFKDDNIAPDTSVTPIDTTDGTPFTAAGDYPGSVGLYQQRLVWAGSYNDPARMWMSRSGDFYEYRPHFKLQTDDAIDFILPITQFANINHIVELGRLFAFSECSELIVGSSSDNQGVSYETIMASAHSHLGCSKRLPPIVANNSLLFVSRTGGSVRDYDLNISNSRYGGTDVSILSSSIFDNNPIVDWTWQQEPNNTVWCVLQNGDFASLTFMKDQKVAAWAIHRMGGNGQVIGVSKTCAVSGSNEQIVFAVRRGTTVTIELLGKIDSVTTDAANFKDCGTHVFESRMTTMRPLLGDQVGCSQFDVKLGQHAHLRLIRSSGGEIYPEGSPSSATPIPTPTGEGWQSFDANVMLSGRNNRDGRVTIRHNLASDFQLSLLELDYEVEEAGQ